MNSDKHGPSEYAVVLAAMVTGVWPKGASWQPHESSHPGRLSGSYLGPHTFVFGYLDLLGKDPTSMSIPHKMEYEVYGFSMIIGKL